MSVVWVLIENEWDGQMGSIEKRMEGEKKGTDKEKSEESTCGGRTTSKKKKTLLLLSVLRLSVCVPVRVELLSCKP